MRLSASKTLLVLTLTAGIYSPAAFGEKKPAPEAKGMKGPRQKGPEGVRPKGAGGGRPKGPDGARKGPDGPQGGMNRPAANPITPIDRWNAMNPRQRERMLSQMPPERKQQFMDTVEK